MWILVSKKAIYINSESIQIFPCKYAHGVNTKLLLVGSEETVSLMLCVSTTVFELKSLIKKLTGFPAQLRRLTSEEDTQGCVYALSQRTNVMKLVTSKDTPSSAFGNKL